MPIGESSCFPYPMFEQCVGFILRHEGGYVNDPLDPGGETCYGICKRSYPQVDISTLTPDMAAKIYRSDYWQPLRADQMPAALALLVFDTAVNCGLTRTASWLQEEINGLLDIRGPGGMLQNGLAVDGIIGPETIRALIRVDLARLIAAIISRRQLHYLCLAKRSPQYLRGWIIRTTDLLRALSAISS